MSTTMAYRPPPTKLEEVSCANHWTAGPFFLSTTGDFKYDLKENSREMKAVSGAEMFFLSWFTATTMSFPF